MSEAARALCETYLAALRLNGAGDVVASEGCHVVRNASAPQIWDANHL